MDLKNRQISRQQQSDKMRVKLQSKKEISKAHRICKKRRFQKIENNDQRIINRNMKVYKGSKSDTNLLNINFKTLIMNRIEPGFRSKQFNAEERLAISKYKREPASSQQLVNLLYGDQIPQHTADSTSKNLKTEAELNETLPESVKDKCSEQTKNKLLSHPHKEDRRKLLSFVRGYIESSQIIKDLFNNQGSMKNKILMVKFIEALRLTVINNGHIMKWKDLKKVNAFI